MSSFNKQKTITAAGALTLALNAAEGRLMLALGHEAGAVSQAAAAPGVEVLFAQEWQAQAQGAELLTPMLDAALRALRLTPAHIGRIAAVNGPGSFTGLRLTVVTAAALARGTGALQAPLPYLPLLACAAMRSAQALGQGHVNLFWVLTHARRGLAYMQSFTPVMEGGNPPQPQAASPLTVQTLQEAAEALRLSPPAMVLGSALARNQEFFAEALAGETHLRLLPPAFAAVPPAFLLRYALELPASAYAKNDVEPLYLRPSDAEENLPHIAPRLGLQAEESRLRLEALLSADPAAQNEP